MPVSEITRVFLSYSRDSEAWDDKVLNLANRLCQHGVDCVLDQYVTSPAEGWPKWMDRELHGADYVLVVCSERYNAKVRGEYSLSGGKGVKWESQLTYQILYDAGGLNSQFIPVLLAPGDEEHIPLPLKGFTHYGVYSDDGFWDLYRHITHQPSINKPPLGDVVAMPTREFQPDTPEGSDIRPNTDSDSGATAQEASEIELFITAPLSSYSYEKREAILKAIAQLLDLDNVRIVLKRGGSTA